jgi:hypothetical protein
MFFDSEVLGGQVERVVEWAETVNVGLFRDNATF